MSEYLLGRLDEKAIRHSFRLIERDGKSLRFCLAAQLLRWVPVRHSGIKRIEDNVSTAFVVKLLHEFAGRVIDDGAVASCIHLVEHLANDARLAGTGVADDQEVLVLGVAWDT